MNFDDHNKNLEIHFEKNEQKNNFNFKLKVDKILQYYNDLNQKFKLTDLSGKDLLNKVREIINNNKKTFVIIQIFILFKD